MTQNGAGGAKTARTNTQGVYPMMPKGYTAARRAELRAFEKKVVKHVSAKAK